jgi:acetyl-CoA synthetase
VEEDRDLVAADNTDLMDRVSELLAIYNDPGASAAWLLCDRYDPGQTAYRVVGPDLTVRELRYADLHEQSARFMAALQARGIGPGDRVATLMGKSEDYLVTLLGIWRLGAVHVPLFTAFAPAAIATRIERSGAKAIVCDAGQKHKLMPGDAMRANPPWLCITPGDAPTGWLSFEDMMSAAEPGEPAVAVGGDAPLIQIYTSGTTGEPKGVIVPLRALAAFRAYAEFGLDLRPDDLFWCAADPGWAYGLFFGILATLSTGTPSLLLSAGFSPELTMAVLSKEGVTNFSAAPTVYRALSASGLMPSVPLGLRCASSAGEPLTPDVNEWAERVLDVTVHDHYGQTEAGMLINNHHHPALRHPTIPGSMGMAMPGWKATVLHADRDEEVGPGQDGRVAMEVADSPLAWFGGYDGDQAKTAEKYAGGGRWYLTGDIGSVDETGYFRFSARDDDVIIMAGYRIGPFEVESVMVMHPAVAEAAVIAVPDQVRGEVMEAYVVPTKGASISPEVEQDIKHWVKTRYAAHAYPRAIHFIDDLPKTPSGKIQRFVLKQRRIAELAGDR